MPVIAVLGGGLGNCSLALSLAIACACSKPILLGSNIPSGDTAPVNGLVSWRPVVCQSLGISCCAINLACSRVIEGSIIPKLDLLPLNGLSVSGGRISPYC